jgi:ribosomal-protein-alanine N-acetyltransferase
MEFILGSIKLRKPKIEDIKGFIEICAEKETMKYYGVAGACIKTKEEAIEQINWCNSQFENNGGRWIITRDDNDEYIGDIGFHSFQKDHNKVEIGYRIKQSYWGKGIITMCINELLKYGFETLNYNRIEALVDTRNEGSKKVLLKNNFKYEGTFRDYEFEHGNYVNMNVFSILKREFLLADKKFDFAGEAARP